MRVFYASTLFGAITLAAAADAGRFGDRDERRLLITATNTPAPEVSTGFTATTSFAALRSRFDDVVSWNDLIAPLHPSDWSPRGPEIPMMSRLIRGALGITEAPTELVLESVAVSPSRTLGILIDSCPVTVYADGLMSYGPTRDDLAIEIGRRASRLVHLDLVPGLQPVLLRENGAAADALPDAAFVKVLDELPEPDVGDAAGAPMIIGQYISALSIITPEEEVELHAGMLRALAATGHRHIVFKPHPAAGEEHVAPMRAEAERLGVRLTLPGDGLPAERWFAVARPQLVVSCFSTALLTASRMFGLPTATMGADLVLDRLTPYQNSNRVPVTIVDAVVPRLAVDGSVQPPPSTDVPALVESVAYAMQSTRNPQLRGVAVDYLAAHGPQRYFANKRLRAIGLVAQPAYRGATAMRYARRGKRAYVRARSVARAAQRAARTK